MRRIVLIHVVCTGALALVTCAHAPPPELESARQAYERASRGPAARAVPAELHKARASLAQAEELFSQEPDSQRARDVAYVAERKSQTAEALAQVQLSAEAKKRADRDYQSQQTKMAQQTRRELSQTRVQLQQTEQARQQEAQLTEQERQARVQAERKAADAAQKTEEALSKLASVKQESRGMVITLSGSVLFASNQAVLLPEAQQRLNQVAEALLQSPDRPLVIEGHTDARGSDSRNFELSQQRAEAVRSYLIGRGYQAEKIQALGIGKSRPVADNATAEGRANNRRVEIVVSEKGASYSTRPHDTM
jgi:outer membrane protein OmpA-like peptidoglycan-associated protein